MDYRGGLSCMLKNPGWLAQTTIIGLVSCIPIVGQIVIIGYIFEAAAYLHKRNGESFPDFQFSRFGPYLARGAGPFLAGLLFAFLHIPTLIGEFMAYGAIVAILVSVMANNPSEASVAIVLAVNLMVFLVFIFAVPAIHTAIAMYQVPLMLRGGMSGEFAESFRFNWCNEFLKRAGTETFMCGLYTMWLSICLMLFVWAPVLWTFGIFALPATGIFALSYAWLAFQLYRAYISERGTPFRIKCEILDH